MPVNKEQLLRFTRKHLGFGSFESPMWFIGIEPADFGDERQSLENRLRIWVERGEPEVDDIREYYLSLGYDAFHSEKPKAQTTWYAFSTAAAVFQGEYDSKAILRYQAHELGSRRGAAAIFNLFPLPVADVTTWPHDLLCDVPFLDTRADYELEMGITRTPMFKAAIQQYAPRFVICAGLSKLAWFKRLSNVRFLEPLPQTYCAPLGPSTLVIVPHPAALPGNERESVFVQLGLELKRIEEYAQSGINPWEKLVNASSQKKNAPQM